tara:strand:+ start:232 stop:924 length:693 start_codon:yes stop_codon:yes gene_type:complete
MAQSFTALGKGNGFPFCLTETVTDNKILLNPSSLAETMNAYWNFDNASWGGASFNPNNEPKDLICGDATLNVGSGVAGNIAPNQGGGFEVRNALPTFFYIDGVKYYKHGISMAFYAVTRTEEYNSEQNSSIQVLYFSSLYSVESDLVAYGCGVDEFCVEEDQCFDIGRSAFEKTQSISSVTISGIPFIKRVVKSFNGTFFKDNPDDPLPPCPTASYPSDPGTPTLTLHTY